MATLIDSYSETNKSAQGDLSGAFTPQLGQSFTSDGSVLDSCQFYLDRKGSPTGNVFVRLYAHAGTFGSTSIPTGSALAVSDAVDITTISAAGFNLITFTFSGANRYSMTNAAKYFLSCEFLVGDGSNNVNIGWDDTSPTHAGNLAVFIIGSGWTAVAGDDTCFYVYGVPATPAVSRGAFFQMF